MVVEEDGEEQAVKTIIRETRLVTGFAGQMSQAGLIFKGYPPTNWLCFFLAGKYMTLEGGSAQAFTHHNFLFVGNYRPKAFQPLGANLNEIVGYMM